MSVSDHPLPSALRAAAQWHRLGDAGVPAMLVHPRQTGGGRAPVVIWIHGRTAHKEMDPGRYLRLMRAGMGVCAVDLPGHGERLDPALHDPRRSLEVVLAMDLELDAVVAALDGVDGFDTRRMGIGGMSAGGMAVLSRLCRPHRFACASVEASTGSWSHQRHRAMFDGMSDERLREIDPIERLAGWRQIPLQAIHSRLDEYVDFAGQARFLEAVARHYDDPTSIELVAFDETGAPGEHIGFGRRSAEAKDRQRDFFARHLLPVSLQAPTRREPVRG